MRVIKASVNSSGIGNANARIAAGDVDKTSDWTFSADDGSKLLGSGDDWVGYSKWHLGLDINEPEKSKTCYMYPFGKNGKVYRKALLVIRQHAAQVGDDTVFAKAGDMLDKIDGKSALPRNVKAPEMRQMAWAKFELTKSYDSKDAQSSDNLDPALENMYIIEGIASTPTPDRMEDIVEPDGCVYDLPLPYLWQHNSRAPIGNVVKVEFQDTGIWSRTAIPKVDAPGILKDRIDEAVQSIKLKLVRGQSIGFAPLEYAYMNDTGGYHFLRWSWLELSAVTIPANMEATIATIKSLDERRRKRTGHRVVKLSKTVSVGGIALPSDRAVKRYGQERCDDSAVAIDELIEIRQNLLK